MKKFKKLILFILTLSMVLSLVAVPAASAAPEDDVVEVLAEFNEIHASAFQATKSDMYLYGAEQKESLAALFHTEWGMAGAFDISSAGKESADLSGAYLQLNVFITADYMNSLVDRSVLKVGIMTNPLKPIKTEGGVGHFHLNSLLYSFNKSTLENSFVVGWNTVKVKLTALQGLKSNDAGATVFTLADLDPSEIWFVTVCDPKTGEEGTHEYDFDILYNDVKIVFDTLESTYTIDKIGIKEIESVTVNPIADAKAGKTYDVTYTVTPEDATYASNIKFTSSDNAIARINAQKKLNCVSSGNVTFTVEFDGDDYTTTFDVQIAPNPVTAIAWKTSQQAEQSIDLKDTQTVTLEAEVTPEDAENTAIRYTSSDETIATVSNRGRVTFLKAGEVTITAAADSNETIKVSVKFTVTDSSAPADGGDKGNDSPAPGKGLSTGAIIGIVAAVVVVAGGVAAFFIIKKKKA